MVFATPEGGVFRPILAQASLNRARSSALLIAFRSAPMSSTSYFSSVPRSDKLTARFRAVWPPMVGSKQSGRSFAIIFSTSSGVIGSRYVASAVPGSVIIVAGLEFTRTTR
eukprot:scaffold4987_cov363-Prasinococcus_capsulatus_cf.AAC.3